MNPIIELCDKFKVPEHARQQACQEENQLVAAPHVEEQVQSVEQPAEIEEQQFGENVANGVKEVEFVQAQ